MDFINQMEPVFDDAEQIAMNEYLLSGGWGTEFKKTRQLEEMIKEYTGAHHCWMMPNGTLSLSCALYAVGVRPGDEVIVPDYTMAATPNSVRLIGATVVFADINRDNLCLDFEDMKKKVTEKTRAVMFVSINGRCPDNIVDYVEYCKERDIHFIEDAAQSLGSKKGETHLGRFGEIGSFSFSAPKIITTGQGGALITDDDELSDKIKHLRDFGRDVGGSDHYVDVGWNLKFSDFQAVIGIEQMKKLPDRVKRKKEMGRLYVKMLEGIDGVETIPTNFDDTAPWFFDALCDRRTELKDFLKDNGVGTREFYPPLHSEPVYNYSEYHPTAKDISSRGLWLPSSVKISDEQIRYICEKIREFYL